jgi:hypothetical protein
VKPRAITSKYWKCVEKAVLTLLPPMPPNFPEKLRDVDACYKRETCWLKNYHLSKYKMEVKFREFAKFNTKCSDLEEYLNNPSRNLNIQNDEYWRCESDCISEVCGDVVKF